MSTATTPQAGAREYARLLLKLHERDPRGEIEAKELDAICDQMDHPWVRLSGPERRRLKGLSQDLYAVADGRQGVAMSPEDRHRWRAEASEVLPRIFLGGDVDPALDFLRKPFPDGLPPHTIPFLQARCWERLGEGDVTLVFMKEAERLDPHQAVSVLLLLEKLERADEAAEYAQRIIANRGSSAEELHQAAATLLRPTRQMRPADAKPIIRQIVPVLERALQVYLTTPRDQREIPEADRFIITMLGFAHEQLGNVDTALQLYGDGLARYPGDPDLLTFRGLARIDADLPRALRDFKKAVQAGSVSMWSYYFLAWDAFRQGRYAETWQLCLRALERPGGSNRERAQLYEWLGMALAESGQGFSWALDNLRHADHLDPDNERIRHNLAVAERKAAATATATDGWIINGRASREQALQGAFPEGPAAPDLFVERSDTSLAALLQHE